MRTFNRILIYAAVAFFVSAAVLMVPSQGARAQSGPVGPAGVSAVTASGISTSPTPSHGSAAAYNVTPPAGVLLSRLPKGMIAATLGDLFQAAAAKKVTTAVIDESNDLVAFTTRATGKKLHVAFFTFGGASSVSDYLLAHNVNVQVGTLNLAGSGSINWLPIVLIFFALLALGLYLFFRHQNKKEGDEKVTVGPNTHGGTHSSLVRADIPDTTFADVAGCEEAVTDLAEFVEFLSTPERFTAVGATMPKGALLCGPPGTGKTLLARAVAGEAQVPFYAVSGSDFTEIYVGVGPKRVRELFARARKAGKAIIFIDEIDAIAKKRSDSQFSGGDSERESTLIALLNEMDGFRDSEVIVIAATNRPDVLDPAILRPGRLDRRLEVPLPDRRGREKILAVHVKDRPTHDDVDLEHLARRTSGMSGAELAQIVNEACIEAARAKETIVRLSHFDAAVATVAMGRARTSAVVTDQDRLVTAWHEAGHTVCAYVQDAADKPVSVSIIPRGPAGGVTWMAEGDEIFLQRSKASARLVTALGGRAAEELLLGDDYTQGAYGDLTSATNLAYAMATRYGMTSLGLMVRDPQVLGEIAHAGVTVVVEGLLEGALDEARRVLSDHRAFMEAIVEGLLDNDTLSADEIDALYHAASKPRASEPASLLASLTKPVVATPEVIAPAPTPKAAPRPLVAAMELDDDQGALERIAEALTHLARLNKLSRRSKNRPGPVA